MKQLQRITLLALIIITLQTVRMREINVHQYNQFTPSYQYIERDALDATFRSQHRPTWVEIDLDAIKHNLNQLYENMIEKRPLIIVLKADGYGHGAFEVAVTAIELEKQRPGMIGGVAVATVEEALILKSLLSEIGYIDDEDEKNGDDKEDMNEIKELSILLLGASGMGTEDTILANGIIPTVVTLNSAKRFGLAAKRLNYYRQRNHLPPKLYPIELKVDTGMNRVGITISEIGDFIKSVNSSLSSQINNNDVAGNGDDDWAKYLRVSGIYTHMSKSDEQSKSYSHLQLKKYRFITSRLLKSLGGTTFLSDPSILGYHGSNSATTIDFRRIIFADESSLSSLSSASSLELSSNEKMQTSKMEEVGREEMKGEVRSEISVDFSHFRVGLSVYGMYPSPQVLNHTFEDFALYSTDHHHQNQTVALRAAMTWKTQIVQTKILPIGERVSYGGRFITTRPTVVATLPVGYADGYRRELGNPPADASLEDNERTDRGWWTVIYRGREVPIIGRICMDMMMIDITDVVGYHFDDVEGEEVILMGCSSPLHYNEDYQEGDNKEEGDDLLQISVDEIATRLRTINYEITTVVGKRVPRVYFHKGKMVGFTSLLGRYYGGFPLLG